MTRLGNSLSDCWRSRGVLKRDVFSTLERGHYVTSAGEVAAVLRRLDEVPWWSWPLAKLLLAREKRALEAASGLGVAPSLLHASRSALVRGWLDGIAMHMAKPHHDLAFFRSARSALRKLHRAGITHNDLAKEQNWIRGPKGDAFLTDFQLAAVFRRRGAMFRLAAYEDLRHLLKHKRRYAPEAITAAEHRVLARKSGIARLWLATGKKVYIAITRGVFHYKDHEGGGPRLVYDAPVLTARLKADPRVCEVAIVSFPDRRSGTGLYAFVEAARDTTARALITALTRDEPPRAPEHLQIVPELPRNRRGEIRTELLQLIAMNQEDLVHNLIESEDERAIVARILAERQNLRDRFAF